MSSIPGPLDNDGGGGDDSTTVPSQAPLHHHHHHHLHASKCIRSLLRTNGRKVHVAGSPDEVDRLRRRVSVTEKDDDFDIVVYGSNEHIEVLHESSADRERLHASFRAKHGDLIDEFETVLRELDELATELHNVSVHAVQLDANFSKYGYSAHLRTRDSPSESSVSSLFGVEPDPSGEHDWDANRHKPKFMRFWKRPIIRQYFHKGLLWRAQEQQEVAPYELFADLFYVGIIEICGDIAVKDATGNSLLQFAIVFILGWKFWTDIAAIIAWFDADDIMRRVTVLFLLTCLLGFTVNIAASWEHTYTPMIAFYITARLFIALHYALNALLIPMVRSAMTGSAVVTVLSVPLWIGSIHVHEPHRQALIWVSLLFDMFGGILLVIVERGGTWMGPRMQGWAKRTFEFYPGSNIEHKIERTGAFVTLVFGYSVISILYQNHAEFGMNAFFGKAVLALIQAFAFNWLYFEMDSFNLHTHAIRRHVISAMAWIFIHLPFIMSFVLSSSALSKLVLAHDTPDSNPDVLWEEYVEKSEEHLLDGQRWFYCAGLAIALASMGIISLTHSHRASPTQRLAKHKRILFRFLVALAILLLPLARSLNSLHLIATTCCLVVLVLVVELAGATCIHETFWWELQRKNCAYNARCGITKEELAASAKNGVVVNVEEIAKRGTDQKVDAFA